MPFRAGPPAHRRRGRRWVIAAAGVSVLALSGAGAAYASTTGSGTTHLPMYTPAGRWNTARISAPPTTTTTKAGAGTSSSPAPPSSTAPTPAAPPPSAAPAPMPPVTYTVKPGDTLSTIAAWFKLHGYQALYQANSSVIGSNPDLIFPGQTITIANGVMTTGS